MIATKRTSKNEQQSSKQV